MEGLALSRSISACMFLFSIASALWVVGAVLVRGFNQIIAGMQAIDSRLADIGRK